MLPIDIVFPINEIKNQFTDSMDIELYAARLDQIHSIVSGNKLYKLHYFIEEAKACNHNTIITFGGAYSNHLVATAWYSNYHGLKSIGIIRGEKPDSLSHTLIDCMSYNMELIFIPREQYAQIDKTDYIQQLKTKYPDSTVIPEGGYHPLGAKGASLIMNQLKDSTITHICTAVGSATTLAGLLQNAEVNQKIVAVPVIKNMTDIPERLTYLHQNKQFNPPVILDNYHFGGYAKYDDNLLNFIYDFNKDHQIISDFVYTGKMFFAVMDQVKKGYFKKGSKVICLHTGGTQGNFSLPSTSIIFK